MLCVSCLFTSNQQIVLFTAGEKSVFDETKMVQIFHCALLLKKLTVNPLI